ncbi:hypothetical protein [Jiangella gansuensis]|uniref:hypothetical protein n=1 Tax=Jiangella gansuensis TaxID=281473 RepID=UPI00047A5661|nr:hypothetical protein [Jiangella gansuensis]
MVKLPEPDAREIIARAPVVDEMVGEMVAHLDAGNPHIDVEIKPYETTMYARFDLIPKEARQLAAELVRMADVAQNAAWTPALLAQVRERYLPGATDAQIVERLNRLARRESGFELVSPGVLDPADGYQLTAEAHRELVERVAAALSAAGVTMRELDTAIGDLRAVYAAGTEDAS